MRESQKCSSLNLYGCSVLVHVVQSVLQWGKDPIVVVKREEGSKIQSDGKNESVVPEEKEITLRCKRGQTFSCDS